VDVVKQQNALAARDQSAHGQPDDFFWRNTRVPVIRLDVGAEVDEAPRKSSIQSRLARPPEIAMDIKVTFEDGKWL
jgi:hypothetical protein